MSICLSCGHQRDSCEICGGDLEDAHIGTAMLETAETKRAQRLERIEAAAMDLYDDYCQEYPQRQRELRDALFAALEGRK